MVLQIPARKQKNRKDQTIPTIPDFAKLLASVPIDNRTGWIFEPQKLRGAGRFTSMRQVGRVITKIGKAAQVSVNDEGKPASAHDLRRSFGQRLADAGMAPTDLQTIMRHSTFATTKKYYLKANAIE